MIPHPKAKTSRRYGRRPLAATGEASPPPETCDIQSSEDEELPLRPSDVLLAVKYVGFCGSDLNTYCGRNPLVKLPVIPGHEVGARIEAVGCDVPDHLTPGVSCTVNPYTACGHCSSCRNGRPNACRYNQTFGVQRDGAMCEYIVVPWQKVIADAAISPRDFCLVEPMSVGFHAIDRAQVTDLDVVMVIGCGMIGAGALVRAALRGAKVIAVDVDDAKLLLAGRLGAHVTVNSRTEDVHERLQAIVPWGPDVVVEAAGTPATYRMAVDEVAFTGRVVCIGYAQTEIAFETKYFVQKELDIRGSRNAMPEDFRAVMEYLRRGVCPTEELISGIYAPEQAQEALERWKADPGKVFRILVRF
ncbi:MAG: zinc-binding alcohol dehydrogenase family protein [Tannerella sp.]|jgi:threonine dehydrogenase-like Zn-dependent dehydrogenase|nr:zinc-binding alcohol dehydrogenase family protein [Tannerella sp.]